MSQYREDDVEKLEKVPLVHDTTHPDHTDDDGGAEGAVVALDGAPIAGGVPTYSAVTGKHTSQLPGANGVAFSGARVYKSTNTSVGSGGSGAFLTFDSERVDTDSYHSSSLDTGRLTIPASGVYLVGAQVTYAANGTGMRVVSIVKNHTTTLIDESRLAASGSVSTSVHAVTLALGLVAGDYLEVFVFQTSGGSLNVIASAEYTPEFWIARLGV